MAQKDADYGEWYSWQREKYELEHGMITTSLPKDWIPEEPYPGEGNWVYEFNIPKDVVPR